MADRIEREIEEILEKLDVGSESDTITGERAPIPITSRRRARANRDRSFALPQTVAVSPAVLLLAGAAVMVIGMILANWWEPLIWLSFAGVVLFIAAFAWSFRRRPATSGGASPRQVYWRDRYIDVSPAGPGIGARLRHLFRRR